MGIGRHPGFKALRKRIWWTIFTDAIQLSQRRPEKPESDRFEDTNTDVLLGTTASTTWALTSKTEDRGALVLEGLVLTSESLP
jgi:hypothetical protein